MEKENKYRVHVVMNESFYEHKPYIEYVIQKRVLGFFWTTISEPTRDKSDAERMCAEMNKYNN